MYTAGCIVDGTVVFLERTLHHHRDFVFFSNPVPLSQIPAELITSEAFARKGVYTHSSLSSGFEPLLIVGLQETYTAL